MFIPLQPLRIPTGWKVAYNRFREIDPTSDLGDEVSLCFKQDLLQLLSERWRRLLDLGWYPDGDIAEGVFRISVHEGDFRGPCLHTYESRERCGIVAEIERLLIDIDEGRM
jgi:hypothetical protein